MKTILFAWLVLLFPFTSNAQRPDFPYAASATPEDNCAVINSYLYQWLLYEGTCYFGDRSFMPLDRFFGFELPMLPAIAGLPEEEKGEILAYIAEQKAALRVTDKDPSKYKVIRPPFDVAILETPAGTKDLIKRLMNLLNMPLQEVAADLSPASIDAGIDFQLVTKIPDNAFVDEIQLNFDIDPESPNGLMETALQNVEVVTVENGTKVKLRLQVVVRLDEPRLHIMNFKEPVIKEPVEKPENVPSSRSVFITRLYNLLLNTRVHLNYWVALTETVAPDMGWNAKTTLEQAEATGQAITDMQNGEHSAIIKAMDEAFIYLTIMGAFDFTGLPYSKAYEAAVQEQTAEQIAAQFSYQGLRQTVRANCLNFLIGGDYYSLSYSDRPDRQQRLEEGRKLLARMIQIAEYPLPGSDAKDVNAFLAMRQPTLLDYAAYAYYDYKNRLASPVPTKEK